MRKIILTSALCVATYLLTTSNSLGPSGTPSGVTTAKVGCGGSGCHGSPVPDTDLKLKLVLDGDTSAVTDGKYRPNGLYHVTASFTYPGTAKYGYIVHATIPGNLQGGTFSNPTSDPNVKLTTKSGFVVVEHPAPVTPVSGALEVKFDWTAPAKGKGTVSFYYAANSTNNNTLADPGDRFAYKAFHFAEGYAMSVSSLAAQPAPVVYPNPATDVLNLDFGDMTSGISQYYRIYSAGGSVIAEGHINTVHAALDVSGLAAGVYFLGLTNGQGHRVVTFNKQ